LQNHGLQAKNELNGLYSCNQKDEKVRVEVQKVVEKVEKMEVRGHEESAEALCRIVLKGDASLENHLG